MNNCMAIRADWPQVTNWINLVFLAYLREPSQMMDMDEALSGITINCGKVEFTDVASRAIMRDALSTRLGTPLISVDGYLPHSPLIDCAGLFDFFGQCEITAVGDTHPDVFHFSKGIFKIGLFFQSDIVETLNP